MSVLERQRLADKQAHAKAVGNRREFSAVFHLPSRDRQIGTGALHSYLEKEVRFLNYISLIQQPFPAPTSYVARLDRKVKETLNIHAPAFVTTFRTLRPHDRENMD